MTRAWSLTPACTVLLLLLAGPASAGHWTLGANFGFHVFAPKQGDSFVTIAAPGSVGQLAPGFMPGLRIGYTGESGAIETSIDQGLYMLSSNGETLTQYQLLVNFQGLLTRERAAPYLTVGGGFVHSGFEDQGTTVGTLGGGLGMRYLLGAGHGAARVEIRADYFAESSGFVGGTAIGAKAGFDLFMN